ncbi:zinc-dependent metalloprotease [Lewinella sp. 4G2]|uniref:zinc-dependent metalloprotease n=1 Tax=Lewinella sp. 4G2 TaxID=1803372 RepID=UPI000AF8E1AA|nr:zinc-dependent metalloprotease [Lewinella sp. 4G2]
MSLPRICLISCFFLLLCTCVSAQKNGDKAIKSIAEVTAGMEKAEGYFTTYWSDAEGKVYVEIDRFDEDFLYVNSLAAGLGSNDIGLDRNQLGDNRVVRFQRVGPKVLLVQRNLDYRAVSDNEDEVASVRDAFAQSVLFGFKAVAMTGGRALIDLTPMLLSDAHGVIQNLKRGKQGSFKVDASRSAVYRDRTKNFPKNSEFEATLTFTGEATGRQVRSVAATPNSFSLRMHHSFVELPDDNYRPRKFDPRSGYFQMSYADYATPIDQPLRKRFITRHRLEKKNPAAATSEAVEPIVYYLDRGAPEPVKSALLEGARWWNEAFEAAGYKNAFRVEVLPEGADPLDVRYNVINWVHRSTRGWSYGSSVIDPRTGEIIKGHVLLGSLRVRQDFLLAQGLVPAYAEGETPDPRLQEMALARLRQLSAHEVGHTIGLAHNFAASVNGRSSVMDYPHPYVTLKDGEVDFSKAYGVGIGSWDKRTIQYGYQEFAGAKAEREGLATLLEENERMGLLYLSDADARPVGSSQPNAHLWDNGVDATQELVRLLELREHALAKLGVDNLAPGQPVSELEKVLTPVYLMHRYQVEAVAKKIAGYHYQYETVGGYESSGIKPVNDDE